MSIGSQDMSAYSIKPVVIDSSKSVHYAVSRGDNRTGTHCMPLSWVSEETQACLARLENFIMLGFAGSHKDGMSMQHRRKHSMALGRRCSCSPAKGQLESV